MCELYHSLYLFIHMKLFKSIHDHNSAKSSHRCVSSIFCVHFVELVQM